MLGGYPGGKVREMVFFFCFFFGKKHLEGKLGDKREVEKGSLSPLKSKGDFFFSFLAPAKRSSAGPGLVGPFKRFEGQGGIALGA